MATKQPPGGKILPKRWEEDLLESPTHDRHGKLRPGHRGIPRTAIALRWRQVDEQIWEAESDHIPAVMEALRNRALDGDERAARVWLDRVAGKVREQPEREHGGPAPEDLDGIRATVLKAIGADASSLAATAQTRPLTPQETAQAVAYLRAMLPQATAEVGQVASMSDAELLEAVRAEVAKRGAP